MIKNGFRYKAFNVKEVKGNKIVFNIADRGKDGVSRYVSVMVNANAETSMLLEGDQVTLEEIIGLSVSEYRKQNGEIKTQVTIFANISLTEINNEENDDEEEDTSLSGLKITHSDLPF